MTSTPKHPSAERRKLLEEWNRTETDIPTGMCVHHLVEAQARRTPDAQALIFRGAATRYAELEARANRLAHHLRRRGVGPGSLVGLCVERSAEMVVALLGILKAGAAYLPLDPDFPQDRLAFMLADAGVVWLVGQESLAGQLPAPGANVVRLDADAEALAREPSEPIDAGASPRDLAYVIYTSGSTGRPKGVQVPHAAVVNFLCSMAREPGLRATDRLLAVTTLSFDIAVLELLLPLSVGAVSVIAPREVASDGLRLRELLASSGATALQATPATWRLLLAAGWAGEERLAVLCGGEALLPDLAAALVERAGSVWNLYGPTETTVWSTCHRVTGDEVAGATGPVAIGRPIANTRVYVLDERLEPVPVGEPGELYIGGHGVTRGYLNRPELTAERFLPDPFRDPPQERIYRTGDVARFRPDGVLEYLGRVDHQVKIRGYRVELGEIEAVLGTHPAVRENVVVVRENEPGSPRLVAYVVPSPDREVEREQAEGMVEQVQAVYDQAYLEGSSTGDEEFDISGWNSSYTGEPIAEAEMREWVDWTNARIRSLEPRRVLEIGCGSGMLLFQIAPGCEEYRGTDISRVALDQLSAKLARRDPPLAHVTLLQRGADEFDGIEPGHFDTVIVNSVLQLFPSVEYLLRVLEGAVRASRPGGRIFLGDVRSLSLLEAYHASVELHKAVSDLPTEQLRRRVHTRLSREEELLLAPGFFAALRGRLPRVAHVELQLKRGRHHNELTRFRYDAVLYVDEAPPAADAPELDWAEAGLSLESLRARLAEQEPVELCVRGVPNARLASETLALELLADPAAPPTAGGLRAAAARAAGTGIDPERVWALGEELPYEVDVAWAREGLGRFDVLLRRRGSNTTPAAGLVPEVPAGAPPERFANDPLAGLRNRTLLPRLRSHLREKLPDYMIPSTVVFLERLPLTANGKIDRLALPEPEEARPELEEGYVAPRTPVEESLAAAWSELLGLERIGIHDGFVAWGGNSLLATQMLSRVRDLYGLEVPLIYGSNLTVAELAGALEDAGRKERVDVAGLARRHLHAGAVAGPGSGIPRRDESVPPLPSHLQEGLWFLDQLDPGNAVYNVPGATRLSGRLDVAALERALGEILRRHEPLRTRLPARDHRPVLEIAPPGPFSLPLEDLSSLPGLEGEREALRRAAEEARRPFDLARGPLFRAFLLRLAPDQHVLVFNLHHIATDGWSMGVFTRELVALYKAFTADRPSPLPELGLCYSDYAAWQRARLEGEALEGPLGYWRRQLAGELPVLALPTDRPRPPLQTHRGGHERLRFSRRLTQDLRAFARREGATTFEALLAAFYALLFSYTGQEEVIVGSPFANRERSELEGLIGYFVNLLPLRANLSGNPSFRELLARVAPVVAGARAHQEVPFGKLVEALQPPRDPSRNPIFQVEITLIDPEHAPAVYGYGLSAPITQTLQLPGLTLSPLDVESGYSKFDLVVLLWDMPERLGGTLEYNADLFEATTVARTGARFVRILERAVGDPGRRLRELVAALEDEEAGQRERERGEQRRANIEKLRGRRRRVIAPGDS